MMMKSLMFMTILIGRAAARITFASLTWKKQNKDTPTESPCNFENILRYDGTREIQDDNSILYPFVGKTHNIHMYNPFRVNAFANYILIDGKKVERFQKIVARVGGDTIYFDELNVKADKSKSGVMVYEDSEKQIEFKVVDSNQTTMSQTFGHNPFLESDVLFEEQKGNVFEDVIVGDKPGDVKQNDHKQRKCNCQGWKMKDELLKIEWKAFQITTDKQMRKENKIVEHLQVLGKDLIICPKLKLICNKKRQYRGKWMSRFGKKTLVGLRGQLHVETDKPTLPKIPTYRIKVQMDFDTGNGVVRQRLTDEYLELVEGDGICNSKYQVFKTFRREKGVLSITFGCCEN